MLAFSAEPAAMVNSTILLVARALAYNLVNVYAIKMAGVFMISASTMILYTKIAPRWIAILVMRLPSCCYSAVITSVGG